MTRSIKGRLFIVGCERSGTTLLQSLLAANSRIASFPESHFYTRLFSTRPLLSTLGIASRQARPRWYAFLAEIGHSEMRRKLPRFAITVRQLSRAFVEVLDTLTLDQGKTVWVEKTPGHLHRVEHIERLVPGAKFIHVTRNGPDNIASLYDVGTMYPERWRAEYRDLDWCIERWMEAARLSRMYMLRQNHRLVGYEHLAADPTLVLVELCQFIGVPFEDVMLTDYSSVATRLILSTEPWKASVCQPIRAVNNRFCERFTESQRRYILGRLSQELDGA